MRFYEVKAFFEIGINLNGYFYLVIFGRHGNGYFCAIPNWGLSCEMAEPEDIFYNTERLRGIGLAFSEETAKTFATEIWKAWKIYKTAQAFDGTKAKDGAR